MRIVVVGLGYVGTTAAACLAELGHEVIGVDVNAEKVDQINRGKSPISEPGLADLIGSTPPRPHCARARNFQSSVTWI